jgi:arylsulfatase A-like enzyme
MPTMLAAAGRPIPSRVQGKNRIPDILKKRTEWAEPVFTQNVTQPRIQDGPHQERMVRWKDFKLIVRKLRIAGMPPMDEMYDLSRDPGERENILGRPEFKSKAAELAGMMHAWGRRIGDAAAVELSGRYL